MKPAATVRTTNDAMRDDNIIPFPRNIRVQIEMEMARAIRNFGHTPDLEELPIVGAIP